MSTREKFGFDLNPVRYVDLDFVDPIPAGELSRWVPEWRACINCGSCAATCPTGNSLRMNAYLVYLAGSPVMDDSKRTTTPDDRMETGSCILCGKCQLVCPRGINTRYLMIRMMQNSREYAETV